MQAAASFRHHMIDGQLEPNRVLSDAICAAMGVVPREWFVPEALSQCAYADEPLPLDAQRYMLPPLLFGQLLQALDVKPKHKVLAIGSATGYGAAVLHHLGCHVYMLEESQDLANRARQILTKNGMGAIEVHTGSLQMGHQPAAPYDRILVEGGVQRFPEAWWTQLSEQGGQIAYVGIDNLLPLPHRGRGFVKLLKRQGDERIEAVFDDVAAPVLPGTEMKTGFDFGSL